MKLAKIGLCLGGACLLLPLVGAGVYAARAEHQPLTPAAPVAANTVQPGLQAYVDAEGHVIARPAGAPAPAVPAAKSLANAQEQKSNVEGGGWSLDTSGVQAYDYATVSTDGKISKHCEVVQGAPAQKAGE